MSLYADFRRKGNFTAAGETQYEVSRTPEKQRFLTTWFVMTPLDDSPYLFIAYRLFRRPLCPQRGYTYEPYMRVITRLTLV